MVVQSIYCAEQIILPENLASMLKTYSKAVIRTQPYDLLRWSAAYFRCMAENKVPPVKHRYEREEKYGNLTKGCIRVLIDQLGKGYYIQKKVLFEKWQALALTEDELLKVLSLTRMLNWTQLHWLKVAAVLIALLNKDIMSTLKMICELLTDEPEGGSAPIPMWMFRECFNFIAELDCNGEQTFLNGRKVLEHGLLEDEHKMIEIPKVLSTISFKNAVVDEFKRKMGFVDTDIQSEVTEETDDKITEISDIPSRIGSNIRIFGDFDNPSELVRCAPDFDSILIVLEGIQGKKVSIEPDEIQPPPISREKLEHAKEREQEIRKLREQLSEQDFEKAMESERVEMFREMAPPWLMFHLFAADNSKLRSYNFIELSSHNLDASPSESSDDSFDFVKQEFITAQDGATPEDEEGEEEDDVDSKCSSTSSTRHKIVMEILNDVVCMIEESISEGKCSISDTQSLIDLLDEKLMEKKIDAADHEKLKEFLDEAKEQNLEFNDLNELNNFLINESFKSNAEVDEEKLQNGDEGDKNIVSIFGQSGIEVDNNLLAAKISEDMILGLVHRTSETTSAVDGEEENGEISISVPNLYSRSASITEGGGEDDKIQTRDEGIQTVPFEKKCRKFASTPKNSQDSQNEDLMFEIGILPGIGPTIDPELVEDFLNYLQVRAFQQKGMIYPRNFYENECPKLLSNE